MKLSIIIPVYNAEKYLEKCMKSIFDNIENSFEVILINDGSKDNSLKKSSP
ncbi:glycosyltransferase family 2 protein [Enterococcus faecium]|uniref:glycosyltransferase family 2 protein n=1 Tax=Enterococcus faecium TaxID=1352 RepID=UPI0009B2D267|nr:glycosyltransferase [Enterococcus faecium]